MPLFFLNKEAIFPHLAQAREDGLVAVGGTLSPQSLLAAYKKGIFPWFTQNEPILWWSPDPRMVLIPQKLHVSRRLNRLIRQKKFQVTFDTAFELVIRSCAEIRTKKGEGTWITPEMREAYLMMHHLGYAHSVEVWQNQTLAGGLYGIALGKIFFGESMFARISNASKVGFVSLVQQLIKWQFVLIDCQMTTRHLASFGAQEISRTLFLEILNKFVNEPSLAPPKKWHK